MIEETAGGQRNRGKVQMKIKVKDMAYEEVLALPVQKRKKPQRPNPLLRGLVKALSAGELKEVGFTCETVGMERLSKKEPALFLMNHSSFIDLKIAFRILKDHPFQIVCTSDGFVGKNGLMRGLGCIPTRKFLSDVSLVRDMSYAVKKLHTSVLMYPEASYSFDGTATPLPESLGQCVKLLDVPAVMIRTYGAFTRDPLYNNLQLRKTNVSAKMTYLLSRDEVREKSAEEINAILKEQFTFDNFRWQKENKVSVTEPFRADGLNRVLYRCPACLTEGKMLGKGIHISCGACEKTWELTEYGELLASEGDSIFTHIPDWYAWERDCVRKELEDCNYLLDIDVSICMMVDTTCVYRIGDGHLRHDADGFVLQGCDGQLNVTLSPASSYSLYSDYFWYEIGDMICIGDKKALYYCFPKEQADVVAKTRLATEELYKIVKSRQTDAKRRPKQANE